MIDTSMPDTLSVNEKEYEIIELLGKGKGGYSYLASDGKQRYVLSRYITNHAVIINSVIKFRLK